MLNFLFGNFKEITLILKQCTVGTHLTILAAGTRRALSIVFQLACDGTAARVTLTTRLKRKPSQSNETIKFVVRH